MVYRPPDDLPSADLLVLIHTIHPFGEGFEAPLDLSELLGVPIRCRFTRDRSRIDEANATIFVMNDFDGLPDRRDLGHPWVMMSMESDTRSSRARRARGARPRPCSSPRTRWPSATPTWPS